MWLRPINYDDALYVARNMRESDRREIYALRWEESPEQVAATVMACGDFAWIAGEGESPIATLGAWSISPNVWSIWMFATDEIGKISLSLTRFAKRRIIPALLRSGAHRAECRSIEGHDFAHRWLECLGGRKEAEHPMAGKNRETFYTYAWTLNDVPYPITAPR